MDTLERVAKRRAEQGKEAAIRYTFLATSFWVSRSKGYNIVERGLFEKCDSE